jgi:type II secretory pathway pseudopilin PulG
MTLVLIGIGIALAIPSYRDMVEKRQVTNGAEQLAALINTAQGVAQKTNQMVTFTHNRSEDDAWCIGVSAGDSFCDCTETDVNHGDYCQIDSLAYVLNNSSAGDRVTMNSIDGAGGKDSYYVDPIRGLFLPCDPAEQSFCQRIELADLGTMDEPLVVELRSHNEYFRLNLMVNNTGRVILCSKDESHAVPGYEICDEEPVEEEV